jgi:hypothetical protein
MVKTFSAAQKYNHGQKQKHNHGQNQCYFEGSSRADIPHLLYCHSHNQIHGDRGERQLLFLTRYFEGLVETEYKKTLVVIHAGTYIIYP